MLVVAGTFLFLNSIVKTGFETVGPKITKVGMHLGSAKLSPFSGTCQLSELVVDDPEGFKTPSAIKVGSTKVAMQISSVFSDVIQVDQVDIQGPEITLEGSFSGSNLGKILDNLKSSSSTEEKQPGAKKEKNIFIKDLVINGGKINVSITALGGKVIPVPLPSIHLENIGTKEKGVTMAEASKQIMDSILTSANKAAQEAVGGLGKGLKDAGNGAKEGATKAVEGIKGLFK
jgi:hypothetical protein